MKRKVKLFATIASLCLSIALMAFGVYAASTVTYTAKGTVTYEVTDVFVQIKTRVVGAKRGEDQPTKGYTGREGGLLGVATANSAWQEVPFFDSTNTPWKSYDANNNALVGDDAIKTENIGELNFADADLYKIEIQIISNQDQSLKVSKVEISKGSQEENNVLTNADIIEKEGNAYLIPAGVGQSTTLTFYIGIESASLVASGAWSIHIEIEQDKLADE